MISKTKTNPTIFNLHVKRGVMWSKRKVEVYEKDLKYFNPGT
jgi:hypothetical protein